MVFTKSVVYKQINDLKEIEDVVSFQEEVWGKEAVTSLPQLIAASHHGGIVVGAFHDHQLIGFSYGFSGFKNHEHYLISHMTAVHPNYHNLGIGFQLKLKQREWAIEYGYTKIVWTFDPLESRNAYFNINKLGAYSKTYIPSYYGEMSDKLNKGLPSDRLLIEWDICSDRVKNALEGSLPNDYNPNNYKQLLKWRDQRNLPYPVEGNTLQNEQIYLIPVPVKFQDIKQEDFEVAKAWRYQLRNVLTNALSKGYKVTSILKDKNNFVHLYVIESRT